jgi:hypothetical protein
MRELMNNEIIKVVDLKKHYLKGKVKALDGVNVSIIKARLWLL